MVWRWLRGRPGLGSMPPPEPVTKVVKEYRQKIPLGYMSISEQINLLIVLLIIIMANV